MISRDEWIFYLGAIKFPYGEASSRRVYGIAKSLLESGYNVVVGSGELIQNENVLEYSENKKNTLSFIGLNELPPEKNNIYKKSYKWFYSQGEESIKWLEKQPTKPAFVILYQAYAPFVIRIQGWCKKNNVRLINDVVEWYDSNHINGGILGPFNIISKIALIFLYQRSEGIITISNYLKNYYQQKSCKVIRVPPILDLKNISPNFEINNDNNYRITLAYAGTPGKKDLIDNVVEAIFQINQNGNYVNFRIAGPSKSQILKLKSLKKRNFTSLPKFIELTGFLPHKKSMDLLKNADFMPIFRPVARYSQAGFPTKIPESLSVGTPVICNITSDLKEFITNEKEGLISPDFSPETVRNLLEYATTLQKEKKIEMRYYARTQAECSFDYKLYSNPLRAFLNNI